MISRLFTALKSKINPILQLLSKKKQIVYLANPSYTFGLWLLLGVVPFFALGFVIKCSFDHCRKIDKEITRLESKTRAMFLETKKRQKFAEEFHLSDASYLKNYVEPLSLMSLDIQVLEELQDNPFYRQYRPIQRRLELLKNGENQIRFTCEKARSSSFYEESEWALEKKVLVNYTDLKQLLVLLEGIKIDQYLPNPLRPQIFIKKFDVEVTSQSGVHKDFTLDMSVIQRGCHEVDKK